MVGVANVQRYIVVIISLLLILSVGWQGLYFKSAFYYVALGITTFFTLGWFINRKPYAYSSIMIVSLLTLLPFLGGVEARYYLEGWVRFVTYLLLFILLHTYSKKDERIFYFIGVVVTAWSYLVPTLEKNRYGGVFEYANTTAIIVGSFILFGLIQYAMRRNFLWLLPILPMMNLIILTDSKGALICLALCWLIALSLLQIVEQVRLIAMTLTHIGIIMFFPTAYMWLGLLLVIAIHIILKKIPKLLHHRLVLPLIATVLTGVWLGVKWQVIVVYMTERATLHERLTHWKDALVLIRQSPFWGYGYRGFERQITTVQSEPYRTIEAHNGYLDFIINYGIVGFLFATILIIAIGRTIYRQWHPENCAPFIVIIAIALHSAMDFTLSYGFVGIILVWALHFIYTPSPLKQPSRWLQGVMVIIVVTMLYLTTTTIVAGLYDKAALSATTLERYEKSLQRAIQLDNTEPTYALKQLEYEVRLYTQRPTTSQYKKVGQCAQTITTRFSEDPFVLLQVAKLLETVQDFEQSLKLSDRVIALDKYELEAYALAIKIASKRALTYYAQQDKQYLAQITLAHFYEQKLIKERNAVLNEVRGWDFRINEEANYYLALLALLVKDDEEVLERTLQILRAPYPEAMIYKNHAAALRTIILKEQNQSEELPSLQRRYPELEKYEQEYQILREKIDEEALQ